MFSATILGGLLPFASLAFLFLCLAVSSVGFRRVVYFISVGYGMSVAAMALVSIVPSILARSPVSTIAGALMLVYGLRLGVYLIRRESNETYRRILAEEGDRGRPMALGVKVAIWITVSVLYVMMFMPLTTRLARVAAGANDPAPWLSWTGTAVMAFGIVIEALADRQKDQAKRKAPDLFCDRGLYSIVRYPNYFGELVVWTGALIAGASLLGGWLTWGLSAVGYLSIFLIMKGSARRLELKQAERYGGDPAFQAYIKQVPILFPFVPIYSFRNAKIYLG